jgi:hypothetical protein
MHRKIIVLSVDYDPKRHDDPASWDWATLTDQPGTTVVAAGFVGKVNDDGDINDGDAYLPTFYVESGQGEPLTDDTYDEAEATEVAKQMRQRLIRNNEDGDTELVYDYGVDADATS